MFKTLITLTVFVSLLSGAGKENQYRKTVQSPQPVSFWLLGETPAPLTGQKLQTRQPLSLKARELLIESSENGRFIIQTPAENKITYSLYSASGALLSQFSQGWNSDLPLPKILIDVKRERIIRLDLSGRLSADSFSGVALFRQALAPDAVFTYENNYAAALNEASGEITVALSHPQQEGAPQWETRLFVLSPQGTVVKERIFKKARLLKMDMKADGGRTALMLNASQKARGTKPNRTLVLNSAGKILWESDFLYRNARFADPDHVLLMGKHSVRFVNINNGKILWELDEAERIFDSAVLTKNGFALLVSGRPEYIGGELFYRDTRLYQTDCFKYQVEQTVLPQAEIIPGNIRQSLTGDWMLGARSGIYRVAGLENDQ